jgi:hypothetical protein
MHERQRCGSVANSKNQKKEIILKSIDFATASISHPVSTVSDVMYSRISIVWGGVY